MLDTAIAFARAGVAVHWLKPRRKNPVNAEWSTAEVHTTDSLARTYREGYNLGVRLGEPSAVPGGYLQALDVDIRDASKKQDALDAARHFLGDLNQYPTVRSGSGGLSRHIYFISPEPLTSRKLATSAERFTDDGGVKHYAWEVELFGTGKQVVLPPSIHPDTGQPYAWHIDLDLDLLEMGCGPVIDAGRLERIRAKLPKAQDADPLLNIKPPMGLSPDEARLYLLQLPEEFVDDYEKWLMVGMALHHEFQGDEEGFDLWDEWSQRGSKYDSESLRYRWGGFEGNGVGFPSVVHHAGGKINSYDRCRAEVEKEDSYQGAVTAAAKFTLMSAEQTEIIKLIIGKEAERGGTKPTVRDVRTDIKAMSKELLQQKNNRRVSDLETWIAHETLKRFYAGGKHLILVAKQFWLYHKGVWRMHDDAMVKNRVYKLIQAVRENDRGDYSQLLNTMAESGRDNTANSLTEAVYGIITKMMAVDSADDPLHLNQQHAPSVMNCRNAELWFNAGTVEVRDHDPDNRFTVQVGADYDPHADCPEWDAALETIFGQHEDTEEVIRHFHEVCGYMLQASRQHAHWCLFYGTGSNGKSFVSGILQMLLGDSCTSQNLADFDSRTNSHAEAGIVGKLMLVDDDFKAGVQLPGSALKKLSEAKSITANPKFKDPFNFVSRATPLILSNHLPRAKDASYGLLRRAVVFHFNRQFSEQEKDVGLGERIVRNELSGVLNRMIAGWQRLQARGYLDVPDSCARAKQEWHYASNIYVQFLDECVEFVDDPAAFLQGSDLWEAFKAWKDAAGLGQQISIGRNKFYQELGSMQGVSLEKQPGKETRRMWKAKLKGSAEAENLFDD